jgi:hypothetical protein
LVEIDGFLEIYLNLIYAWTLFDHDKPVWVVPGFWSSFNFAVFRVQKKPFAVFPSAQLKGRDGGLEGGE